MSDDATEPVIALAKRVIGQLQVTFPGWSESMFALCPTRADRREP